MTALWHGGRAAAGESSAGLGSNSSELLPTSPALPSTAHPSSADDSDSSKFFKASQQKQVSLCGLKNGCPSGGVKMILRQ